MNPNAHELWRAPRWTFALLLALLGTLGPFAVDTYLPAFSGIAQDLGASKVQLQQTLSAYLFAFGFMSLFHGAISDSLGRRPMILWGLALFMLATVGCAVAQNIGQLIFFRTLQGLCTGACIVIARAIPRDMYPPQDAQQIMSKVTIYFGVAVSFAPLIGGWLFVWLGWRSIFWFIAALALALWVVNLRLLPETLHSSQRHRFDAPTLLRGYLKLGRDPRFLLLAVAVGVPINGTFMYLMATPVFLGEHLGLAPTQFFWFFLVTICGVMSGAAISGRMAGRVAPKRQIRAGYLIMLCAVALNVGANWLFKAHWSWAFWPLGIYCVGWAIMQPALTLLLLDLHPERRGMASSLQIFMGSMANSLTAGVLAPLAMHSTLVMAVTSAGILAVSLGAWLWVHRAWPEIGRRVPSAD
jgi:MFS transporter, DHA1 family, multidrug resistance protein